MGELARKPGCPKLADTPLELLTPRPGEGFTTGQKLLWPTLGVLGGLGSGCIRNALLMRPLWAGIPFHIFMAGAGGYIGMISRDSQFAARSESDAVLKHYVSLHPDDFPPFERKRWRDVYLPFNPIR